MVSSLPPVVDHVRVVPTAAALVAARSLGAGGARLIRYGNSAAASGDDRRVVGYAGYVVR